MSTAVLEAPTSATTTPKAPTSVLIPVPEQAARNPRKLWTRDEYRRMFEEGVLEDGKYELVLGEVWVKMGQGRRHTLVVMRILEALVAIFGFGRIQSQSSLGIGENGNPEPDAALLTRNLEQYLEEDPQPADMLLVVEASDSTLQPDLTDKARQYGLGGIPEYWVVDIPNRLLHVFREPTESGYANETILTIEDEVRPLAAPESVVRVADLLP